MNVAHIGPLPLAVVIAIAFVAGILAFRPRDRQGRGMVTDDKRRRQQIEGDDKRRRDEDYRQE